MEAVYYKKCFEKEEMVMDLFASSLSVSSSRILYTPTSFARASLFHLQEVGSLKALYPHISTRTDLVSFLYFIVIDGKGQLTYEGKTYHLNMGDCVFIDCKKAYSHSTGNLEMIDPCKSTANMGMIEDRLNPEPQKKNESLWSLQWCHFYGSSLSSIYEKYKERGGQPVFHPKHPEDFIVLLSELYDIAASSDYVRDMRINEKLSALLTLLMEESWHPERSIISKKRMELTAIRNYLDEHYTERISLDDLAARFYINKYYLAKIFKETYGSTINNYLIEKRITHAKQLLRFSSMTVEDVGSAVGMDGITYFSRMFKKIEGISPREYRKQW